LNNILSFPKEVWRRLRVAFKLALLDLVSETSFIAIGRTIRVEKFPDRDFSDDEKIDELINHTRQRICGISPAGAPSAEIESLVTEFSSHSTIVELLNLRNSALLEIGHLAGLGPQPGPPEVSSTETSVSGAWSSFKSWRHAHSIARNARKAIEARKAPKFDVSGSDIAQAITLISVSLVTGGFFYQVVFFKKLGIDITRYLSVSDYLSASIGAISPAAVSMGINAYGMILGVLSFSKSNKITKQARLKSNKRFLWMMFVIVAAGTVMEWLINRRFPFESLPFFVWTLSVIYVPEWCDMYFKRPLFMVFIFLFAIYFSASIYSKAKINAISVEDGSYFKGDGDRVDLDDSVKSLISDDQLRLLETTPNFCFLYDTKNHKIWIFPKEKVKAIYGGAP
jgi:hypothetical protein